MIVFDVDGTLIGGESTDWASFDAAFEEAAGFALPEHFFSEIEEVTAQAIVHQALFSRSHDERRQIERAVADGYIQRLREAHRCDPLCFPVMAGVIELLHDLKTRGILVAIATGDWRESITFKLRAAGFPSMIFHWYHARSIIAVGTSSLLQLSRLVARSKRQSTSETVCGVPADSSASRSWAWGLVGRSYEKRARGMFSMTCTRLLSGAYIEESRGTGNERIVGRARMNGRFSLDR